MSVHVTLSMDDLIIIRNALKLLLQQTPEETREPVAQMLTAIEFHIAAMIREGR